MRIVLGLAYIEALERFPEKSLGENLDIALAARNAFFNVSSSDVDEPDEDAMHTLLTWLKNNNEATKHAACHYLLIAYFYRSGVTSEFLEELAGEAIEKAQQYVPGASPLGRREASQVAKKASQELKDLTRKIRTLNHSRIEKERLSIIGSFKVTSSHILFALSIFSSLFLAGGFVYNYFFFRAFGIHISDFFQLQDYISSSVTIITSAFITTLGGLAFYALGMTEALDKELHAEQFQVETSNYWGRYGIPALVAISTIGLIQYTYLTGEILSFYLYPLVFFLAFQIFYKLPIWKYIENPLPVGTVILIVLFFSIHLGLRLKDDLSEIKDDKYESAYQLEFVEEYEKYDQYKYISETSDYVFLLAPDNNTIVVVPSSAVTSYTANS